MLHSSWILGSSSTFRLFRSYEPKKVSGRFPDEGRVSCARDAVRRCRGSYQTRKTVASYRGRVDTKWLKVSEDKEYGWTS